MGSIRTLLAIAVVMSHAPWGSQPLLVGGQTAVQAFYIVSGFLIARILSEEKSYQQVGRFYLNRALRIYPIYFVVAAMTLAVVFSGRLTSFAETYEAAPPLADLLLVSANALIFGQDWIMFLGVWNGQLAFVADFAASEVVLWPGLLVPQAWTLGVELSFYLIAPFVLRRPWLVFALLGCSLALKGALMWYGWGDKDPWSYRFFPAELSLFLLGSVAQRYFYPWFAALQKKHGEGLSSWCVSGILLMSILYPWLAFAEVVKNYLYLAVFLVLLSGAFLFQTRNNWDRAIGELSYPIYIGHIFVIWSGPTVLGGLVDEQPISAPLYALVGSVAFAAALNWAIARPMEQVRARIKRSAAR